MLVTRPAASGCAALLLLLVTGLGMDPGPGFGGPDVRMPVSPAPSDTAPDARAHHQLVFHEARSRVLLLGGSTRRGEGYDYFQDVWALEPSGWRPLDPMLFRRSSHRAVYDRERSTVLLYGGVDGDTILGAGGLWRWNAEGWSHAGAVPDSVDAGRVEPGLCYDFERDRVVLFGGWNRSGGEMSGTTWEWSGTRWQRVATKGPGARAGHALVFDPVRRRCLLFGGRGDGGFHDDTWAWDGTVWRELDVEGPSPRWFFGVAAEAARDRIVLFGGAGPDGDLGDTWTWDGSGWERIALEGPPARSMAKMASDGSAVVLFGGRSEGQDGFFDRDDTWRLEGASWRPVFP